MDYEKDEREISLLPDEEELKEERRIREVNNWWVSLASEQQHEIYIRMRGSYDRRSS